MRFSIFLLSSYFHLRQTRRSSAYRCIELIKYLPELHSRKRRQTFSKADWTSSTYIRKREKGRRYAAAATAPIESLPRWSALRPTNVIGRTLIASEPAAASDGRGRGGQKVSGRRKDPLAESIFRPSGPRKAVGNFLVLSRSDYPLILPFSPFFSDFDVSFVYPASLYPPLFRHLSFAARLDIGFSNGYHGSRKAIAERRDNADVSSSRLFRPSIDNITVDAASRQIAYDREPTY